MVMHLLLFREWDMLQRDQKFLFLT
jgi:hypothetical protein